MSTINDWPAVGERIKFDRATSQICPLCHVFIAKGASWAKRLPRPMVPRSTPDHMQSVDTAGFYYKAHPQPIKHPDLPRWFVHAYCWPLLLGGPACRGAHRRRLEVHPADQLRRVHGPGGYPGGLLGGRVRAPGPCQGSVSQPPPRRMACQPEGVDRCLSSNR